MVLKFITGNQNKFNEVARLLSPIKAEQVNIDLAEIQEVDPEKIIKHKIQEAFKHHKGKFIVEDGSVFFECFDYKLPGPLIKWFNDTIGNKGIYNLAKKTGKHGMRVEVVIGYAKNQKNVLFFKSSIKGQIVKPKGKGGFGFDPIFRPLKKKETFAELKLGGNFNFSPRAQAVLKLRKYLKASK